MPALPAVLLARYARVDGDRISLRVREPDRPGVPPVSASAVQREAQALPLRPYQQAAYEAVWNAYAAGTRAAMLSMATGSGKTIVAAHLIREAQRRGWRSVMLVHRDELVTQSVAKIAEIVPGLPVGVCKAERNDIAQPVVVASAQTLVSERRVEALRRARGDTPLLLVDDECHHSAATARRRAIRTLEAELLVGLTATAMRADKLALGQVYEQIVFHFPLLEGIARDQLAPLVGLRVETESNLDIVHTVAGEFNEAELADAVDTAARNRLVVDAWRQHAAGRSRTVVFAVNKRHALALRDAFLAAGVGAECVLGETPSDERQRIFAAFRDGQLPVLTNCMVLTEGYDEPGIDCVLMCRPTKSLGLYIQCVGRAARKHPGKADALVIDFVDNTTRHSLVTLPTLAGLESDDGDPAASESDRRAGQQINLLELAREKAAAGDKLRERRAIEVDLFGGSQYLWRTVGDRFMAPAGPRSWVTLIPRDEGYVPAFISQVPDSWEVDIEPLFDRPLAAELAMGVAEGKVVTNALTSRAASWRSASMPPTSAQLAYAKRLGLRVPRGATKGLLSQLIDDAAFTSALRRAPALSI